MTATYKPVNSLARLGLSGFGPALVITGLTVGFYVDEILDRADLRAALVVLSMGYAAFRVITSHAPLPPRRIAISTLLAAPFLIGLVRTEHEFGVSRSSAIFFIAQCFLVVYLAHEFSLRPESFLKSVRVLFWITALGFVLVPAAGAGFRGQGQGADIVNLGNELGGTLSAVGVTLVIASRRQAFWFYLIVTVVLSVISESRAALLVLVIVLGRRLFKFDSQVVLRIVAATVLIGLTLLLTPAQQVLTRFTKIDVVAAVTANVEESDSSIGRVVQWEACIEGFTRANVIGGGYGEISRISEDLRGFPKASHSLYCTLGVEGAPIVPLALIVLLAPRVRAVRRMSGPYAQPVLWLFIAVAIQALFRVNYDSLTLYIGIAGVLAFGWRGPPRAATPRLVPKRLNQQEPAATRS